MPQEAINVGNGNTIVQIMGDGNTVVAGHPHLTLTRYVARRKIRKDLDRLSPYTCSTPLIGRQAELASLHAYLSDPRPLLARVLVGGGGIGKTRLALELCEQAISKGWDTGFVTRTELHRFFREQNLSAWGWRKPTLIVVDYAAEHAQLLGQWLDELADRSVPPVQPLRMLLLERSASTDTGWWTTVFASGGWGAANKRELLDPAEPVPVRGLAHADERLALLGAMLKQVSPDSPLSVPLDDEAFRAKLMQLTWGGDPLFLMMAALAMVQVGHAKALTLDRADLADELAQREGDRLRQLAQASSLDPALVQHLAACVTLAQGMDREVFEFYAASEKAAIHRPSGGDAAALADVLQQALPRTAGIAPVLPDLIGEALILRMMREGAGLSAVLRCHASFGQAVAESAIRCAQDFAQHSPEPLRWLQSIVQALWNDEAALTALHTSLSVESVVLRDLNLQVAEQLLALLAARDDASQETRALVLNNLALAQAKAGHHETALRTAQEAVDIYRSLAAQKPDVFQPYLALSLSNLANALTDMGQREPALKTMQEAVALYGTLAGEQSNVFMPDLAMSLNNLASMLGDMDQRELAVKAAQESINIRRILVKHHPDLFAPKLAASLTTLSAALKGLGQRELAVEAAQEAVNLYRPLAAERPDVFVPNLAKSLSNLGTMLNGLARREPALKAAQEAVNLRRTLATQQPDVFVPDLATSLNNLCTILKDLRRREPAFQAARESVDLYRNLVRQQPDVFLPLMAMSLTNLANSFSDLGQYGPALQAAQESVGLYRVLVRQQPDVFLPNLAASLNNLANILSEQGQHEPALQAAQEVLNIRRPLAAQRPDVFVPDLAGSLSNLANRLGELGQHEPALQAAQEAVKLYRALNAQHPDVFLPDLARSLNNLANSLKNLSQREPALQAAQEAIQLYRALAAQRPHVFQPDLARSLIILAHCTRDTSSAAEALPIAHAAVATLSTEFLRNQDAHAGMMKFILREYFQLCQAAGKHPDFEMLTPLESYFLTPSDL